MECGQAFHFERIEKEEYIICAYGKMLHIHQEEADGKINLIFHNTTVDEFEGIWRQYFDLDRDYGEIKSQLLNGDERLKDAIEEKWGVRILNQEFFETLMSFIISQNKQIPQIKQLVFRISECYGREVGAYNNKVYYAFPDIEQAKQITEENFREMKTGFRAPYLADAALKCALGEISLDRVEEMSDDELMKYLMSIKGVGAKVASCVMLFSLSRRSSFPVDVWIKRTMENIYFGQETSKEVISEFAKEHFGELGGYAQQYLFYYGKDKTVKGS